MGFRFEAARLVTADYQILATYSVFRMNKTKYYCFDVFV